MLPALPLRTVALAAVFECLLATGSASTSSPRMSGAQGFSFGWESRMDETMPIFVTALLVSLLLLSVAVQAGQSCRVIDDGSLACGSERVRIMGLYAPEIRGRCPAEYRLAVQARARLAILIAQGVTLHPQGRDRYRRTLAVVRDRRGRDVAEVLIGEGLARAYHGRGKRGGWC